MVWVHPETSSRGATNKRNSITGFHPNNQLLAKNRMNLAKDLRKAVNFENNKNHVETFALQKELSYLNTEAKAVRCGISNLSKRLLEIKQAAAEAKQSKSTAKGPKIKKITDRMYREVIKEQTEVQKVIRGLEKEEKRLKAKIANLNGNSLFLAKSAQDHPKLLALADTHEIASRNTLSMMAGQQYNANTRFVQRTVGQECRNEYVGG